MAWFQKQIRLRPYSRGFHLITDIIEREITEICDIQIGLVNIFIQHSSASLTINENADPDVQVDLEQALNYVEPENLPYIHTCEGPDDMPAHVKASLLGSSVSVPIAQGRLCTGTWQGIYLCEHRNHGGARSIVLTLQGE